MRRKRFYNILLASTLVLAVSAALWFTSPVRALEISFPSLPSSGTLGSTYSFTVNITISDTELLPIQSIDMEIYNVSSPSYSATMTDLPLVSGGTKVAGTISITNTTVSNWYYGYGYGYAVWEGTPYYLGYGYGYGYGSGAASILYNVTWNSPSSWPAGTYKVKMTITANSTTFTETSSQFTLSAPAPPAGPGGGGPPAAPSGCTDVLYYVTDKGRFFIDVTVKSADGKVWLTIPEDTIGKTKEDEPLSRICIVEMEEPPAPPVDTNVIGLVYDISPNEATFEPTITLTITYDPADVPATIDEEDLVIAMWDEDADEWVILGGISVNPETNTITARLSQLNACTVLAYPRPAALTITDLSISPDEVDIGEPVTISVLVTNTGSRSGGYTVILKIDNKVVSAKRVIVAGESSQLVTFTTSQDVAGSYTVTIDELSGTFTVKTGPVLPPPAAAFTTSSLTLSHTEVKPGEPITISIRITNSGDAAGTHTATLRIDDVVVATKEVTLAAGSSQLVTFTTSQDVAGSHTVDVDGLSATFTVKAMVKWWLIGVVIAVGVIVGVIITRVLRRRWA